MGYDLERYEQIQAGMSPCFDPDGDRLLYIKRTADSQQLWVTDGPQQCAEQLTFGPKRVVFASWSPSTDQVIFGADTDGTERVQLYRLLMARDEPRVRRTNHRDESPVTALTDEPTAIHRWGGWSSDGSQFAFTANYRTPRDFDIFVKAADEPNTSPTRLQKGDGKTELAGWSPTDEQLLVRASDSKFDQELRAVSVSSGQTETVTPPTDQVRFLSPQWGPDGESVYCVTDYQSEYLYFGQVVVATGEINPIIQDPEHDIESVAVSQSTGRFVAYRNVEGYTELLTGELSEDGGHKRLPSPELPPGVGGTGAFDNEGAQFVLSFPTYRTANIHTIDLETGETEPWTNLSTAGIPESSFTSSEIVTYSSFDGLNVSGLLSETDSDSGDGQPAIIDVHGGPRTQRRPGFNTFKQYLLGKEFTVFEPNIRGSSGYGKTYAELDDGRNRMDAIKDIAAGASWLSERPGVDPNCIGIMGSSYGGFATLASLYSYPDLFSAGISISGITNLVTFLKNTSEWRRERRQQEYGTLDEDEQFLEAISPISNIEKIETPIFVIHGENDPRVPVTEATQIADALGSADKEVQTLIFENEGHGVTDSDNRVKMHTQIVDFFETHLT